MPSKRLNIFRINRLLQHSILVILLTGFTLAGYGQSNGDYRTRAANNWNNNATWQVYSGGAWVNCAAGNYPGVAAGAGVVTLTHNVTLNVSPANPIGALVLQANLTPNASRTLTVTGNCTVSSGTLNLSNGAGRVVTLNVGGNFTMSGGTITESSTSYGSVVFNGSGTQVFTKSGGTISNIINFTVNSGSNLNMGTSVLNGSAGTFTLNAGATLTTANVAGISSAGATGSIQVTGTRTYNTGANYVYNGTLAQITGTGLPATVNSLTINNISGVTIAGNITLAAGGTLTLSSGILQAGANSVILTNTNPATSVVWTPGSFVNVTSGAMERTLAPGLTGSGNDYLFPIGEGGVFKGLTLLDVNTGATGPVLRATVSPAGALTGDGTTIASVGQRNWSLTNLNSGNLTSARVELYESGLDFLKTIGMSSAVSGDYSSIGGSISGSSLISSTVLNPGPYFSIGALVRTYYSFQTGDWNSPPRGPQTRAVLFSLVLLLQAMVTKSLYCQVVPLLYQEILTVRTWISQLTRVAFLIRVFTALQIHCWHFADRVPINWHP